MRCQVTRQQATALTAPRSLALTRHTAPNMPRLSERAWQGQAVEARGVAPALPDAAGRSSSIGPAIAFHSKCKRGREPELSGSGASAMSQTFLARICKPHTPDLKEKSSFGGDKHGTLATN